MSTKKVFLFLASTIFLSFICNSRIMGQHRRENRPLPHRGERVALAQHRPGIIIAYGGVPYHYDNGCFYRPMDNYLEVVAPPIGIHVRLLPPGYRRIYVGTSVVFYFNGVFYRPGNREDYEVVPPPIGAEVPELADGAKVLVLNEQKLYELDGTYYKEEIRDVQTWYRVIGKDGVVNTEDTYSLQIGDTLPDLPEGCRPIVINNQKYYVSPDHVYYQEVIEDNKLLYTVVGK